MSEGAHRFFRLSAGVKSDMINKEAYDRLLVKLGEDECMKGTNIEHVECELKNFGKLASFRLLTRTLCRKSDEYREKVMGDIWRCGLIDVGKMLDPNENFKVGNEVGMIVKEVKFVICSDESCARCQIITLAEGMVCGPLQE